MAGQILTLQIGDYLFEPVPHTIEQSHEFVRDGAGTPLNIKVSATLEGVVTILRSGCGPCLDSVIKLQQELRYALEECATCPLMVLKCNDEIILETYVRILSLRFTPTNDNWVYSTGYVIELEWSIPSEVLDPSGIDLSCYSCIDSVDESWSVESNSDYRPFYVGESCPSGFEVFNITHRVEATGHNCCISGIEHPGWENAKAWVESRLGTDYYPDVTGIMNFDSDTYQFLDHSRSKNFSVTGGSYEITESWTALPSGVSPCLEDYTIECVSSNSERFKTYSINGTIRGLESRDSQFNVSATKYERAKECWAEIEPQLIDRISCFCETVCPINTNPVSSTVAHAPFVGTISYNYSYYDRPQLIPGSLSEDINISNTKASTVVAQIPVIGRAQGPVFQEVGTANTLQQDVSISVTLPLGLDCSTISGLTTCERFEAIYGAFDTSDVTALLCCLEVLLVDNNDFVYKIDDRENMNPITGSYTRSVSWIYQSCDAALPSGVC